MLGFGAVLSVYKRTTHHVPLRVVDRHVTTPMVITAILSEQPFAARSRETVPHSLGFRRPSSRTLSATGGKPADEPRSLMHDLVLVLDCQLGPLKWMPIRAPSTGPGSSSECLLSPNLWRRRSTMGPSDSQPVATSILVAVVTGNFLHEHHDFAP